ncbi:MAG: DUF420 domain-containing protein [Planctomycetota bacterium]|nr:DUF420 domain-containing protein [Planctomycetota bacterium]
MIDSILQGSLNASAPLLLLAQVHPLATVNAVLNGLATVLLILGFILIKRKQETAHRNVMLAAFGVSVVFLVCYLAYHVWPVGAKSTPFQGSGLIRTAYFVILITHIILAATVPFLAGWTIYLGLKDRRAAHLRLAKWTFPIWLYVSITGVVIYVMLYQLYPQPVEREPATATVNADVSKRVGTPTKKHWEPTAAVRAELPNVALNSLGRSAD